MENPEWESGNPYFDLLCRAARALPFSVHEAQKRAFFDRDILISVNAESVVAVNGLAKVDKFMFRYPDKMSLETFRDHVQHEVGAVLSSLGTVALSTSVSIKSAYIFRNPQTSVRAVTQTQPRLNLDVNEVFNLETVKDEAPSPRLTRTLSDLENLISGSDLLSEEYDFYPDIAMSSGNLRRSSKDGSVRLIDVMPAYGNGSRLIGDRPPASWVPHIKENLQIYQEFVGRFGG